MRWLQWWWLNQCIREVLSRRTQSTLRGGWLHTYMCLLESRQSLWVPQLQAAFTLSSQYFCWRTVLRLQEPTWSVHVHRELKYVGIYFPQGLPYGWQLWEDKCTRPFAPDQDNSAGYSTLPPEVPSGMEPKILSIAVTHPCLFSFPISLSWEQY